MDSSAQKKNILNHSRTSRGRVATPEDSLCSNMASARNGWSCATPARSNAPLDRTHPLESNANPATKAYQEALYSQSQPAVHFLVSDVQADHERLAAKGVRFTMPVTSVTGSAIAVLDDTCDNLIQLTQLNRN